MNFNTKIKSYAAQRIDCLRSKRLDYLRKIEIDSLFKLKMMRDIAESRSFTVSEIINMLLNVRVALRDRSLTGELLRELAFLTIRERQSDGLISSDENCLRYTKDNDVYSVSVKTGPYLSEHSVIADTTDERSIDNSIIYIDGYCIGQDESFIDGQFRRYCGRQFWRFISDDNLFMNAVIVPASEPLRKRDYEFNEVFDKRINYLYLSFANMYCDLNGAILWDRIRDDVFGYH